MGFRTRHHRARLPTKSEREQTPRRVGPQPASRAQGGDRRTANPKGRGDEAVARCGDEPVPTPTLSAALSRRGETCADRPRRRRRAVFAAPAPHKIIKSCRAAASGEDHRAMGFMGRMGRINCRQGRHIRKGRFAGELEVDGVGKMPLQTELGNRCDSWAGGFWFAGRNESEPRHGHVAQRQKRKKQRAFHQSGIRKPRQFYRFQRCCARGRARSGTWATRPHLVCYRVKFFLVWGGEWRLNFQKHPGGIFQDFLDAAQE